MSFMYDNEITTGALRTPSSERKMLAQQSLEANLKNPQFRDMFPEYIAEHDRREQEAKVSTSFSVHCQSNSLTINGIVSSCQMLWTRQYVL